MASVGKTLAEQRPLRGLRLSMRMRDNIAGYLFISPWIIGFLIFVVSPFIASFVFSLFETDLISKFRWVGLGNYIQAAQDPVWWEVLYNTAYLAIFGVTSGILIALALALLLNENVRGIRLFRALFYLPSVIAGVAVFLIWVTIFDFHGGILNSALAWVGIPPQRWLTSSEWVKPSMIIMGWWVAGGDVLLYLAGLKAIPKELYEAAQIDGANRLHRFRHITLPMLSPTIFFVLITGLIGAFQTFIGSMVMTGGGPGYSSMTVVLYLYYNAFRYFKMGYGSAMAWLLFLAIVLLSALVFRSSRAWVYYEGELRGK